MELIRKITILLYPIIPASALKVLKVFEINKSGLDPLSVDMEQELQAWLDSKVGIEIINISQSQHLRENTVFVTVFFKDG